jgi:hypothetical protein
MPVEARPDHRAHAVAARLEVLVAHGLERLLSLGIGRLDVRQLRDEFGRQQVLAVELDRRQVVER